MNFVDASLSLRTPLSCGVCGHELHNHKACSGCAGPARSYLLLDLRHTILKPYLFHHRFLVIVTWCPLAWNNPSIIIYSRLELPCDNGQCLRGLHRAVTLGAAVFLFRLLQSISYLNVLRRYHKTRSALAAESGQESHGPTPPR